MFCFQVSYLIFVYLFHHVSSTEISVTTYMRDNSLLNTTIQLPVLQCHARHTGYKEVSWYKDYALLKKGSAELSDHFLSLKSLLNKTFPSINFTHPLKLQGYYWCQTELTNLSTIFDYLFHIEEIHTFVGKLISTKDSVTEHKDITIKDMIKEKKRIYEEEMQETVFAFLTTPSVYVTDMMQTDKGLEVRFFLYARTLFHPRKPTDNELRLDQDHLVYIQDYLNNETSVADPKVINKAYNWLDFRGIEVQDIELKSTLGCYEEEVTIAKDPFVTATWSDARIGDKVLLDNACLDKNGLPVTRMCTGSFYSGAKWGNPTAKCEKPPEGTAKQMKDLLDSFGKLTIEQCLEKMNSVMSQSSDLDVTTLHIATDILKAYSTRENLNEQEITGIMSVIDKMFEANRTELDAAKYLVKLTSRILKVFDNILEQASEENKEIQISQEHLLVDSKYTNSTEGEHILGFAVSSPNDDLSLKNGSIEFLLSSSKTPQHDCIAYFVLPSDLISTRESSLSFPCQVNMVFFKEWYLFQNPNDVLLKRHYKVAPSPVVYASISGGPAYNLTDPVQLYFKDTLKEKIENPVCVYYDTRLDSGVGAWSSEGCEYGGLKKGFHNCRCHHLSIFAVILSQRPDTAAKYKLGISVYVGCGVSILALSLAVLLFILSKHWRLTIDHGILFCLSLTYLVCIILMFISELHFKTSPGCMILALIFHYTIFAILGWLLVHAVVYKLRFSKKTDLSEIPNFMMKSAFSVWGSPIIIILIIWLSKDYSPPGKDNCWLIVSEVSMVSVIPVVVLMFVILCVNSCATYSLTCRFRKDFLVGDTNYQEPAVKFRVTFTIFIFFVVTWLFGFFALHNRSRELRILFSISMTLTAYYVTLFFIFQEISFWELCSKWKSEVDPITAEERVPAVKYEAKCYKTIEEPNENRK